MLCKKLEYLRDGAYELHAYWQRRPESKLARSMGARYKYEKVRRFLCVSILCRQLHNLRTRKAALPFY